MPVVKSAGAAEQHTNSMAFPLNQVNSDITVMTVLSSDGTVKVSEIQ